MTIDGVFLRYVGRMFATRLVFFLLFFVVILQMLDLLNRSDDIAAGAGADWRQLFQYISLRSPQIASQFAPFAGLLAIVVTLASLNLTSEITIMRAAGMSVHRVLYPIGIVCAAVAFLHFALHETFVVNATEKLEFWQANDYSTEIDIDTESRTSVSVIDNGEIIRIESAARVGAEIHLTGLLVYGLDTNGLAKNFISAERAIFKNDSWTLLNARSLDNSSVRNDFARSLPWPTKFDPELIFALSSNPDQTSLPKLMQQIKRLTEEGADTRAETTSFLSRISKPMSILIMPLLGAIAGFGVSRQGNQLTRAVSGAVLGFAYFIIENLMLALGKLGVVPAMLGAFFPFAIFLVIGFAILLSMEN